MPKNKARIRLVSIIALISVVTSMLLGSCASSPQPTVTVTATVTATPGPAPTPTPTGTPTPTPTAAGKAQYEWTSVMISPSTSYPWAPVLRDKLKEATGGRLTLKVLEPGQHPWQAQDFLPGLRDRKFEVLISNPAEVQPQEPIVGAMELPYLLANEQEIKDLLVGKIYDATVAQPLGRWNTMPISIWVFPRGDLAGPRLLENMDSFKGLKIRALGELHGVVVQAINAVPTMVNWADIYSALQKGVVDGIITYINAMYASKFFEINKFVTLGVAKPYLSIIMVNKAAFNELPKDLQTIVLQVGKEVAEWGQKFADDSRKNYTLMSMDSYGVTARTVDPRLAAQIAEKLKPFYDEWAKKIGPEAQDLLKSIRELHAEWLKTHPQ